MIYYRIELMRLCSQHRFYFGQLKKDIGQLQTKWRNIKADIRRRLQLIKKAQNITTGGGKLSKKEKRIVESSLYREAADKMGASAAGNEARFDSDSQGGSGSSVLHPTKRLRGAQMRQESPNENLNDTDDVLDFNVTLEAESNEAFETNKLSKHFVATSINFICNSSSDKVSSITTNSTN